VLLQTQVGVAVAAQFDALAHANGHKRAAYCGHLVELHVEALTPEAFARSQEGAPSRAGTPPREETLRRQAPTKKGLAKRTPH